MENSNVSLVEDTHHKSPSIQQTTRTSHTTSELVHSHAVNLSMPPGGPTHPFGSLIHPTPTSTPPPLPSIQQLQQTSIQQQPITLTIKITPNNDTAKKNRKKRKHNSYGTPIDSPISLNRDEDSKSESEYGDNLNEYVTRSEAFSDYDTEDSSMITPVDALKRLLMQFTAMSPMRLESILPVLLDNDIDDPDILLLIENEQFLRDLRGKNGSEI
ncbi:14634_t:CDS:2, partial [Racocetra fulgida]